MKFPARFPLALPLATVIALVLSFPPHRALAHPLAPALLEVQELRDGRAEVRWKTSPLRVPGSHARPVLPSHCRTLTSPAASESPGSITVHWTVDCSPQGLVGQPIGVAGLGGANINALLRVMLADGRLVTRVLRPG